MQTKCLIVSFKKNMVEGSNCFSNWNNMCCYSETDFVITINVIIGFT